jgi:hypothetical protein
MKPMQVSVGTRVRANWIDFGGGQASWHACTLVGVPVAVEGVVLAMRARHLNGGTAVLLDIKEDNSQITTTVDLAYVTGTVE